MFVVGIDFVVSVNTNEQNIKQLTLIDAGSVISIDFVSQAKKNTKKFIYGGGMLIANYPALLETLSLKMPIDETINLEMMRLGKDTIGCIGAGFIQSLKRLIENHPMIKQSEYIFLTGGMANELMRLIKKTGKTKKIKIISQLVLLGLLIERYYKKNDYSG